ncbi:GSCFA domain-containing protein [Spirosoma luteolum]
MQFHTEFTPQPLPVPICLSSRIVTLGSCFSDVMGRRLADHKLTVLNNPFGTVFNPVSMVRLLTMALDGTEPDEQLYLERDGVWLHYDFHSSLWASSREALRQRLIDQLTQTGQALRDASLLLLTFGSALVYRHLATGRVVANCHKMPGAHFEKFLYQAEHLRTELTDLLRRLQTVNPTLQVLLTVSPVRHTRDTLPLNQVSKATLRVLTHELSVWHDWVHYFPAYELMIDDLRDYRFYEADLVHPNAQAHDYIFGKFAESAFDAELRSFVTDWQSIRQALAHRPLHGEASPAHRQFLLRLLSRLETLSARVDLRAELTDLRSRLALTDPARQSASEQALA